MSRLYIIGNGFDRYHGMDTDYVHFAHYLGVSNREVRGYIDEYFPSDEKDFWWRFEENLATFDADSLADNSEHLIVPYGAEEWSDAYNHDYAYELEQVVSGLSETLVREFAAWVHSIPMPSLASLPAPLLAIDPTAQFINFNYTRTLQTLYAVADHNVWHIHGAAADPTERLVLGHGWRPSLGQTYVAQLDMERDDTRVQEGARILDRYFAESFKPTNQIITGNQARFQSLADVDDIRVLGHSLADVDLPYLREVIRHADPAARWRISYHRDQTGPRDQFAQIADPALAVFLPIQDV